jgi:hypothetical protein
VRHLLLDELMWLVGLYEGEGHFAIRGVTPILHLKMTDAEVVNKAAHLLEHQGRLYTQHLPSGKTAYSLHIAGNKAAEIMERFEPHMCTRNTTRIREILAKRAVWRAA